MSTAGSASVYSTAATSSTAATKTTTSSGNDLDKNAFMKILMAEISNQDPTSQSSDPTAYVSQLAQYSSLEQMTNLNDTMTLSGATSLIGKNVEFSKTDSSGKNIEGTVKSVSQSGDNVTLDVQVTGSTTLQQFKYSDIMTIDPDATATTTPTTTDSTTTS